MLTIGINEGWRLVGVDVTDKGAHKVMFGKGKVGDLLDYINADLGDEPDEGFIYVWPPMMKNFDQTDKQPREIVKDLRRVWNIYAKMFAQYLSDEQLKEEFPMNIMFAGTEVTGEQIESMLKNENTVLKLFKNLGKAADKVIKNHGLADKEGLRIKFIRQSKKKAFPDFVKFPERDDWVELMSIPREASKVKFSAWEIENGYNDATIPTDDTNGEVEEVANTEELPTEENTSLPFD